MNTLYDFNGDTLLSPDKTHIYVITRAKLLNIINKTEENIKDVLSIEEVLPILYNSEYQSEYMINFTIWYFHTTHLQEIIIIMY